MVKLEERQISYSKCKEVTTYHIAAVTVTTILALKANNRFDVLLNHVCIVCQ